MSSYSPKSATQLSHDGKGDPHTEECELNQLRRPHESRCSLLDSSIDNIPTLTTSSHAADIRCDRYCSACCPRTWPSLLPSQCRVRSSPSRPHPTDTGDVLTSATLPVSNCAEVSASSITDDQSRPRRSSETERLLTRSNSPRNVYRSQKRKEAT